MNTTATYPQAAGYKEPGATSQQAAEATVPRAQLLRLKVLDQLRRQPATADEVAERLDESILSVRPRLSELRAQKLIEPSGNRRKNRSGASAAEWRLRDQPLQPDLFQIQN